ncbi:hypothetical protein BJA01nite_37990 [Bradyrhizobium japonicum]|nr:hypothetical protein BJ6T_33030 [Bradyrhizobium japonicum USDA 6]GEC46157.1 hypothetical protein BJA01nite_37990 [Bradyrhizobium japonicum]
MDDELRRVPGRPLPLRAAGEGHAARAGPWGGSEQDPGDLAVAPDERNLHASGRDNTAAVIADAPHSHTEWALHPKRDTGSVRKHDYILRQMALDLAGKGNVG